MFFDIISYLNINDPYLEGFLRQCFHFTFLFLLFFSAFYIFKKRNIQKIKYYFILFIFSLYFFIGVSIPECVCDNSGYVENEQCESLCKYDLYTDFYFRNLFRVD